VFLKLPWEKKLLTLRVQSEVEEGDQGGLIRIIVNKRWSKRRKTSNHSLDQTKSLLKSQTKSQIKMK
jgi:hypothetical protein